MEHHEQQKVRLPTFDLTLVSRIHQVPNVYTMEMEIGCQIHCTLAVYMRKLQILQCAKPTHFGTAYYTFANP